MGRSLHPNATNSPLRRDEPQHPAHDLLASFAVDGKAPVTVLVIAIDAVFFQCGRAVLRSGLWSPEAQVDRPTLPSAGAMLRATSEDFDAEECDRALPARQRATLY